MKPTIHMQLCTTDRSPVTVDNPATYRSFFIGIKHNDLINLVNMYLNSPEVMRELSIKDKTPIVVNSLHIEGMYQERQGEDLLLYVKQSI